MEVKEKMSMKKAMFKYTMKREQVFFIESK